MVCNCRDCVSGFGSILCCRFLVRSNQVWVFKVVIIVRVCGLYRSCVSRDTEYRCSGEMSILKNEKIYNAAVLKTGQLSEYICCMESSEE